MKKLENIFLYLVVLGGRAKKANVELHDVRWVVGSKIEDTFGTLRKDWFGSPKDLHIDSYKKIRYIDGYKINLINFEKDKIDKKQLIKKIGNWEIELTKDNSFIQENNYPDWYGYQKIDGY